MPTRAALLKHTARKSVLPLLLIATSLLGGCYYTPYPGYYPSYAYAPAPAYGGVYIGGPVYGRRYWR